MTLRAETGAGTIRLRAWGQNAENLIDPLLEALQSLPIGQPPKIMRTKRSVPTQQFGLPPR